MTPSPTDPAPAADEGACETPVSDHLRSIVARLGEPGVAMDLVLPTSCMHIGDPRVLAAVRSALAAAPPAPVVVGELVERLAKLIAKREGRPNYWRQQLERAGVYLADAAAALTALSTERDAAVAQISRWSDDIRAAEQRAEEAEREAQLISNAAMEYADERDAAQSRAEEAERERDEVQMQLEETNECAADELRRREAAESHAEGLAEALWSIAHSKGNGSRCRERAKKAINGRTPKAVACLIHKLKEAEASRNFFMTKSDECIAERDAAESRAARVAEALEEDKSVEAACREFYRHGNGWDRIPEGSINDSAVTRHVLRAWMRKALRAALRESGTPAKTDALLAIREERIDQLEGVLQTAQTIFMRMDPSDGSPVLACLQSINALIGSAESGTPIETPAPEKPERA